MDPFSQPSDTPRNVSPRRKVRIVTPPNSLAGKWQPTVKLDPCCWCGTPRAGTVEHLQPRSQHGSNRPKNLVGACASCNSRRGTNSLLHWMLKRLGETG